MRVQVYSINLFFGIKTKFMFDIIDFSCGAFRDTVNNQVFHTLIVNARVNGFDLLPSGKFCFDARNVLAQEADCGAFSPFACHCGTAECAGILEGVVLEAVGDHVVWTFPNTPFSEWLDSGIFAGRQSLSLRFVRSQYLAALDQLRASILKMERVHGLVNYHCGPIFDLSHLRVSVSDRMYSDREAKIEASRREADRVRLYGSLYGSEIRMELSNGAILSMKTVHVLQHCALMQARAKDLDARAVLVNIVKSVRETPEAVLALAKSLTWAEAWNLCWIEHSGLVHEDEMANFSAYAQPIYESAVHSFEPGRR